MIESLTPILYDFKRSFLRLSTLLFLILFTIGGIGTSYLSYNAMITQYPPVNMMALVYEENNTCVFMGIVYDMKGELVDRANIKFNNPVNDSVLADYNVNGNFTINDKGLCKVLKKYVNEEKYSVEVKISTSMGESTLYIRPIEQLPQTNFWPLATRAYITILTKKLPKTISPFPSNIGVPSEIPVAIVWDQLILLSKSSGEAKLVLMALNITNSVNNYKPRFTIEYSFIKSESFTPGMFGFGEVKVPENLSYNLLDELRNEYFGVYSLRLDVNKTDLVLRFKYDNSSSIQTINYELLFPIEAIYAGALSSTAGLGLFVQFFPIVFLYLAYSLMAKPRSIGALEFILARPVTRWDIYLTRYLAGILTAFITTAALVLSVYFGNILLLGTTLDTYSWILLYFGIVGSLIAFYSLFYLLASSIRSSAYLAIGIMFYLLFTLFWNIIILIFALTIGGGFAAYTEYTYLLAYFNPKCSATYSNYYINLHYEIIKEVPTANPLLAVISTILWIIGTFILGYCIFRRINLSS